MIIPFVICHLEGEVFKTSTKDLWLSWVYWSCTHHNSSWSGCNALSAIPHIPFETNEWRRRKKPVLINPQWLSSFNCPIVHPIIPSVYPLSWIQHSIIKTHVSILSNTLLTLLSVLSVITSSLLLLLYYTLSHTDRNKLT